MRGATSDLGNPTRQPCEHCVKDRCRTICAATSYDPRNNGRKGGFELGGWMCQGCEQCREGILSGRPDLPAPVAVSRAAHAYLRQCPTCGACWEEGEREAHVIGEDEVRRTFAAHCCGQVGNGAA